MTPRIILHHTQNVSYSQFMQHSGAIESVAPFLFEMFFIPYANYLLFPNQKPTATKMSSVT